MSLCAYCGVGCGMEMKLDDDSDRVTKTIGRPDHPTNFGRLCTKGSTTADMLAAGGRLSTALVRDDRGGQLRRLARQVRGSDEGDLLTLDYRDLDRLAGLVAGAGADAVALEPPELVAAVIRLLTGVTGDMPAPPAADQALAGGSR